MHNAVTRRLYDYQQMARTALREPEKVRPYLRERVQPDAIRQRATLYARTLPTYRYPAQIDLLDELRESDRYCLVVLDACRWDYFDDLAGEYLDVDAQPARSFAHDTFEWGTQVWHSDRAAGDEHDVRYVSGAIPINNKGADALGNRAITRLYRGTTPGEHIRKIDPVWRIYWDESLGAVPPEPITTYAQQVASDADRLVVHYFQPHTPYIGGPNGEYQLLGHHGEDSDHATPYAGDPVDKPIWEAAKSGEISDQRLHEAYRATLRRVLGEVARLADTLDRKVVVTADHGEALGEYGRYAHERIPHPKVRTVPWAVVDGVRTLPDEDGGTATTADVDHDVEDRLADLGYLEGGA